MIDKPDSPSFSGRLGEIARGNGRSVAWLALFPIAGILGLFFGAVLSTSLVMAAWFTRLLHGSGGLASLPPLAGIWGSYAAIAAATLTGGGLGLLAAYSFLRRHEHEASARRIRLFAQAGIIALLGVFFFAVGQLVPNYKHTVRFAKVTIAIIAAGCVFYEQYRRSQRRPIAERWQKLVGIALALMAIGAYFNGFRFGYPKYYHRWDQYHYYMGAKYFPEMGYKNLYKCAVVAQDEINVLKYKLDRPFNGRLQPSRSVNMRKEMRDPDKKIRDLLGENLLLPVQEIIANKHECIDRFSPERWKEYKQDVAFYRITSGKGYWTDMQKDHGFNPPPVWTVGGKFFADLHPASVAYSQFLASIDVVYLIGMFIALWWGFGWRVCAVGAIFWGCQASAPFYWTGGAFLRQDWLFFSVLSVSCMRKRHFKIAGAALVYAGLLRIFPGLVVIGTLVPTIVYAIKHKRMHRDHLKMLIGGTTAAALLMGLSLFMTHTEKDETWYHPYKIFYEHTIETHDKTPLTNHMGLRVIVGHKLFEFQKPGLRTKEEAKRWLASFKPQARPYLGLVARLRMPVAMPSGPTSGHMQHVRDNRLNDPFEPWKRMRNERYEQFRWLARGVMLASLIFFIAVVRRFKLLWIAQCLGQIFIILGSQLTCYYYSFMILSAPLIKLRRELAVGLFGLAAITQLIDMNSYWNDTKYTLLTVASLAFCYLMLAMLMRRNAAVIKEAEREDQARPKAVDDDSKASAAAS